MASGMHGGFHREPSPATAIKHLKHSNPLLASIDGSNILWSSERGDRRKWAAGTFVRQSC